VERSNSACRRAVRAAIRRSTSAASRARRVRPMTARAYSSTTLTLTLMGPCLGGPSQGQRGTGQADTNDPWSVTRCGFATRDANASWSSPLSSPRAPCICGLRSGRDGGCTRSWCWPSDLTRASQCREITQAANPVSKSRCAPPQSRN
jgi:hypothetical protein